ncbi:response regulator [Paenibacillus sp. HB172176]|uniref:response regulator n=1 Tax=Paenibacillus sp. HB172176 TaxID=2493690 RepID=UPI00143A60FB|nr:response regulator [Paenibacillus sp. HB172176]
MKILIIEDEPQSLEGMKRMVEQLDAELEHAFFCRHAGEAMEVIEEHLPELIVTDIILPDSTGLDLMESIQIDHYEPKVIIVSGFDNFDYAKRGLKLGAVDYFLKPFDTAAFSQKLLDCMAWVREEKRERQERHHAKEMAHLGTRSMRDVFLSGLCLKPAYLQEHIHHRLQTWGLEWLVDKPCRIFAITMKAPPNKLSEREEDTLSFAIGNIIEELLQRFQPSVTFQNAKRNWIIIASSNEMEELLMTLSEGITRYQKVKTGIGVSEPTSGILALHQAYSQSIDALRAALLSREQDICRFEQLKEQSHSSEEEIAACMLSSVAMRDVEGIRESADLYVHSLVMNGKATRPADYSQSCMDFVMGLQEKLQKNTKLALGVIPLELWEEMDDCESMDDLSAAIANYFQELALQLKGLNKNSLVEQALSIIHERYTEDLKLQQLADELNLHPVWLSQLFKKEVGTNFLDYVTELRMQKAKELLRHSNMKIYEIVEAVGYQDIHYFGKLFKKKTGESPKAFRYGK